jgi:hypothetical protein
MGKASPFRGSLVEELPPTSGIKSEEKLKAALALKHLNPWLGQLFDSNRALLGCLPFSCLGAQFYMYLLTIRDGLQTRHVGPYQSPKQASDDLDRLLPHCAERARWQIHSLESPDQLLQSLAGQDVRAVA